MPERAECSSHVLALIACAQIAGAAPLLKPRSMVLIGEMHGSREIPRAVESLACMAKERRVPVTVAVELPIENQPAFWRRARQDGRSSGAMAHLVKSGFRVARFDPYFDPRPADAPLREEKMAQRLIALRKERPRDLILVLSGNLHNRITVGVPWDAAYKPMGWYLVQRGVRLVSLQATYDSGETWMCDEKDVCGPHAVKGVDRGRTPFIEMKAQPDTVHGTLYVGPLSPSPPASKEAQ